MLIDRLAQEKIAHAKLQTDNQKMKDQLENHSRRQSFGRRLIERMGDGMRPDGFSRGLRFYIADGQNLNEAFGGLHVP